MLAVSKCQMAINISAPLDVVKTSLTVTAVYPVCALPIHAQLRILGSLLPALELVLPITGVISFKPCVEPWYYQLESV